MSVRADSLTLLLIHSHIPSMIELAASLTAHGHNVTSVKDAPSGHLAARQHTYDCIVASLERPADAIALCRVIRSESSVPLLVIACSKTVIERVEVLDAGADDCLVAPVTQRELLSRIAAVLRRTRPRGP